MRIQGEDSDNPGRPGRTGRRRRAQERHGTADISDGGVTGDPELVVTIDRQRAADLGLTPGQVGSVLRTGLAGSVGLDSSARAAPAAGTSTSSSIPTSAQRVEQVGEIPIVTPSGATIRLGQIASVSTVSGPTQISRRDRQRSVYVTANLNGRTAGDVAKDVQAGLDKLSVPSGYKVTQGGEAPESGRVVRPDLHRARAEHAADVHADGRAVREPGVSR